MLVDFHIGPALQTASQHELKSGSLQHDYYRQLIDVGLLIIINKNGPCIGPF